jgi:hypothetical protein
MAAGPWGALIGGGIGLVGGLLSGDDDSSAPAQTPYSPNPAAFSGPSGGAYFEGSSGQPGGWWGQQAPVDTAKTSDIEWERGLRRSARGQQEEGLGLLKQYATGDKSAARQQAKVQTEATQAAIASRAAGGGYNPALQAASIAAQAGAGQQIAGPAAYAAAQEQLGAQQAYLQATGQMRGQDLQSQLAEQQWYVQQNQAKLAYGQLKAQYLSLGLQEKEADMRAKQALEAMKFAASEGAAGRGLTAQQLAMMQGQYNTNRQDAYTMGGMNALSGYLQQSGTGSGSGGGTGGTGSGSGGGTGGTGSGNTNPNWSY